MWYLCSTMTFRQKYKSLQDKNFVIEMITKAVYDTMHLEGQGLPKNEVYQIVMDVLKEKPTTLQKG